MKKGISLVALVITIIVLIILTGAIVLTALDVNLFERAEQARDGRNKQEVYSAVQREVLDVQSSRVGLAVSAEFATELKTRLLNKHSGSNATATYNEDTDSIAITFDLGKKTYNLALDNKYRLTMEDTQNPSDDGSDDAQQFLTDLEVTASKYYDATTGKYDVYAIQLEMDEKYPDAHYLYYMNTYGLIVPIATDENFADIGDLSKYEIYMQVRYKEEVTTITGEGIGKEINSQYICMYEDEVSFEYEYESNYTVATELCTITRYTGKSKNVVIPYAIINFDGTLSLPHTIKEKAFSTIVQHVDIVDFLSVLNETTITYDDLTIEALKDMIPNAEELYEEGMTPNQLMITYIQSNGADAYEKDGKVYTYVDYTNLSSPLKKASEYIEDKLESLEVTMLEDGLTIGAQAFAGNQKLTNIYFMGEQNSYKIASDAFETCNNLTELKFEKTIANVSQISGYSSKWGATNATIYCTDGTL